MGRGVDTDETIRSQGPVGRTGADVALPAGVGELLPGDPPFVGAYTLLGRLGAGGMGTVYLALGEDGRQVAVKMIRAELAEDEAFVQRFRREVQAAQRVAGWCTARVLDAGLDAPRPFLVTEYVDGLRLDHAVERDGPLRDSALEGFAVGVAAALTAIHSAGLVHRDLKPSNVLLSRFGPRVIDFGIARALDASTMLTRMSVVMGTPGWMAPEQLSDDTVTTAADVFAWGALVAYAGSGEPPFGEGSLSAVAYRILHQRPSLDGLPTALRRLVGAAMEKDPERRPSARGLLMDLLGDEAPPDEGRAVTEALHRTWTAPPSAAAAATVRAAPRGTPAATWSPSLDDEPTVRAGTAGGARTGVGAGTGVGPGTGVGAAAASAAPDPGDEETTERLEVAPRTAPAPNAAMSQGGVGRRLPAAGNPAAPDRRPGEKRTLPPAGRPFPEDRPRKPAPAPQRPAAQQQAPPEPAPPPPPKPTAPPTTARPAASTRWEAPPAPTTARPAATAWPAFGLDDRAARERPPVSIPRDPPAQRRPATAEPTGPRPSVFRRIRRWTAHLLALPAVVGAVIAYIELFRNGEFETYAQTGTALFALLTLAFMFIPASRQHRGAGMLLRLIGFGTVAALVASGLNLLDVTSWDPFAEFDPFGSGESLWETFSMRLSGLFAVLTLVVYGFPKDR